MTPSPTELFDCERVNSYLDSYLRGQVPPPERRGMRMHIHRCPVCFERVAARDPLQLFAPLADQTARDEFWEGFWPAVDEGIRRQETRRQERRVWIRAAAIVIVAVGVTAALVLIPRIVPRQTPVATAPPGSEGGAVTAVRLAAPLPQTVERVRTTGSGDVQIYTMSYTQGPEPAVPIAELVLIVDKGLEL